MQTLTHNAFPLRFGMRKKGSPLSGWWAIFTLLGEFYGEDSFEEIFNHQEEDPFEEISQVATLLSGYKSNRVSWLGKGVSGFGVESDRRASEIGVFSNRVTLRICKIS